MSDDTPRTQFELQPDEAKKGPYADLHAALDRWPEPHFVLLNDAGGTHVFENCDTLEQFEELLAAALCVGSDWARREQKADQFNRWLRNAVVVCGAGVTADA